MDVNHGKIVTSKEILNKIHCDTTRLIIAIQEDYMVSQIKTDREVLFPTLGRISINLKQKYFFRDREEINANKESMSEEDFKSYLYNRAINISNEIKDAKRANRKKTIVTPTRPVITLKNIAYVRTDDES